MIETKQVLGKYEVKKNLETVLMAEFLEAMKDDSFAKLVGKLKLPYEELCKYTSLLQDSCREFDHCLHCKNLMNCQNKIEGYAYLPEVKEKKLKFVYKPCKFKKKHDAETSYLKNVFTSHEPTEILEARMENILLKDEKRLEVIDWISTYVQNYRAGKIGKGLYLSGSFGSGKTFLISAMFHELAKDGVQSAILFWPEFLTTLKGSFGKDDFLETIDKIKKRPLLLIDDIGAENTTSWSRDDVLCPILQYRMQEKLPTFFTSNLDKKTLEEHFSVTKDGVEEIKARRVMERIRQLTEDLTLVSENLRK